MPHPTRPAALRAICIVIAVFLSLLVATPSQASPAGVLIPGGAWLQGQGVDVYGNGGDTWGTYYQCVELPQARLYPKFGWPRVYAAGNGGAAYIPEGSPGLTRYNPGSGYLPVPGDLVIENPTAGNPYGHVAVVDRVEGNTIVAVEQNASNSGWHNYSYNNSSYAGGYGSIKAVLHAPQNGFQNGPPADGAFVGYGGHVFRIAGGAPLYVSTWDIFGGAQPTRQLNDQQYNALPRYPAERTFIRGARRGEIYVIAGSAPTYVDGSFWNSLNPKPPLVDVDDLQIDTGEQAFPLNHLRFTPMDGVWIRGQATGEIYRVAGGAPVYVTPALFTAAGSPPPVTIAQAAIDVAGGGGAWNHLRFLPVDGSWIAGHSRGEVYRMAGGAPIYVTPPFYAAMGNPTPTTVDQAAVDNGGGSGAWSHLRYRPADGTVMTASGRVYTARSGAAILTGVGTQGTAIDQGALDNAGQARPWDHLSAAPLDPTSTPSVSGTARVGSALSAAPGAWGPAPVTLTYQWLRNGSPITTATATTYTLTHADAGTAISVRVTGSKPGYVTTSKTSTTVTVPPPNATTSFVKAAYQDFLGRQPTPTELTTATTNLDTGTWTRDSFLRTLATSPEWVRVIVTRMYRDTLGRDPDPTGLNTWVDWIRTGRFTVAQAATLFYSSQEFYQGLGGNTPTSWVTTLYDKLLHRAPDPTGLTLWTNYTSNPSYGPTWVAGQFYQSLESRMTRVNTLYTTLLGRTADPTGLTYWANTILTSGDIQLAITLANSTEYTLRAQTRY
jgi:hypothetical protein